MADSLRNSLPPSPSARLGKRRQEEELTPRGVLRPEEAERAFQLRLYAPHPELRRWVEHYWSVSWDLGSRNFVQTVVTNPTIDVSFEEDEGTNGPGRQLVVTGVVPRAYRRFLTGKADVWAVHFHPAQFRPWWGNPVDQLTGQALRLEGQESRWTSDAVSLLPRLLDAEPGARAGLLDTLLLDHRPPVDAVANEIQALVLATRSNPELRHARLLADRRAVSPRTNQRQFLEYVGVGPKWVVMRHRIQDAVLRLDAARAEGTSLDLTDLALELGYYDLAHLSREFRALVGESPDRYRR